MLLRRVSPKTARRFLPFRAVSRVWNWLALYPGRVLLATLLVAFVATHFPRLGEPATHPQDRLGVDKVLHLIGFTVISWLVMNWLIRHWRPATAALLTFIFCASYGAIDELTQPAFGRSAEWGDWFANLVGTLVGITIYTLGPKPPRRPDDRLRAR